MMGAVSFPGMPVVWGLVVVISLVMSVAGPAEGGEVFGFAGAIQDLEQGSTSVAYQVEYREGLSEHAAVSFSYFNEGHLPGHHRDGLAPLSLWGRVNILDRRLSLAAGGGPYLYADTMTADPPRNDHGVGTLLGASATWYFDSRLLLQARVNWALVDRGDTVSLFTGIGYQLDAPSRPGPFPTPPPRLEATTANEVTLFLGQTVVNNPGSANSLAWCIEYRRRLVPFLEFTASWLNEGGNQEVRRNGIITQAWVVRDFFADHLSLGAGMGAYFTVDRRVGASEAGGGSSTVSGIMAMTVGLRNIVQHPNLSFRFIMNRIVTNYDRDTDVFLFGIGHDF